MTPRQQTELKNALIAALSEVEFPLCKLHSARMDKIESALLRVTEILTGNGDASKGLIVKVDRHEQAIAESKERVAKVDLHEQSITDLKKAQELYNSRAWAIIMIGVGLLATSIWNIIVP